MTDPAMPARDARSRGSADASPGQHPRRDSPPPASASGGSGFIRGQPAVPADAADFRTDRLGDNEMAIDKASIREAGDILGLRLQPSAFASAFFEELGRHLDLHLAADQQLQAAQPFSGPEGMICRIETRAEEDGFAARPQLLLPLDEREIAQLRVGRLLAVQETLRAQLGWMLGQSTEGLLQLSPLEWTPEARDVARELDLGSAVGRMVLAMLRDVPEPGEAPLPSLEAPSAH